MSDVLAYIRVKETHGIRRFLYPLTEVVSVPEKKDWAQVHLETETGELVPCQVEHVPNPGGKRADRYQLRVDFAVSLAPQSELELRLKAGAPAAEPLTDPLVVTRTADGDLQSKQQRLTMTLGSTAIKSVVYDGISHLSGPSGIIRNGKPAKATSASPIVPSALSAVRQSSGQYKDGCWGFTHHRLTACKSWVNVIHGLMTPSAGDEVVFTLPLAVISPTLLFDFGVGGGTYGKLQEGAAEKVVWDSTFSDDGRVAWSIVTSNQVDYIGEAASAKAFLPQQWLHLIDSEKALAVAITQVPDQCLRMSVTLDCHGAVQIAFHLKNVQKMESAWFGVCYHFLNNVPAIAAATNPQSILLPPKSEVLPP